MRKRKKYIVKCFYSQEHTTIKIENNIYIQAIGRGTRVFPGKKNFLVLDHVGNINEHGLIENERECILEGWENEVKEDSILNCEKCFAAFSSRKNYKDILEEQFFDEEQALKDHYNTLSVDLKRGDRAYKTKLLYFCPVCSHDNTPPADPIIKKDGHEDDELKELTEDQKLDLRVKTRLKELKILQKAKGFKRGWVFFQLKAEYGEEKASQHVKKRVVPDWVRKKIS